MQQSRMTVLGLCLSLGLSQVVLPAVTLARGAGDAPAATRSRMVKIAGANAPIGRLESTRAVIINGRLTTGQQDVWNGELIQTAEDAPATMKVEAVGQMQMASNSLVRVAAVGNSSQPTLVASVETGSAKVVLVTPKATAYLAAGGQTWIVSGADATAQLTFVNGEPSIKISSGTVTRLGNWSLKLPSILAAPDAAATKEIVAPTLATKADTERNALLRSIKRVTPQVELAEKPTVRLSANVRASMLGMVESTGKLKINGRETRRQELLWDGETVQAPADAEARAALANIAQVRLSKGATAKLSMANATNFATNERVLAANLLQGEFTVRLDAKVGAYVETQGKAFAAEPGAHFRVSEQEGNVTLEIKAGHVREIEPWSMALTANLSDEIASGKTSERQYVVRPADKAGYLHNVKSGTSQDLRFVVTDRTGKAIPGVPVVFTLNAEDGQFAGSFTVNGQAGKAFSARSDEKGVVIVPFTAGRAKGSTSISAVVAGNNEAGSNVVVVGDNDKGFWTKDHALPVFGVIAGAVVAGIVVGLTREEKLPILGNGATQIVP